jgi:hypothetical protein
MKLREEKQIRKRRKMKVAVEISKERENVDVKERRAQNSRYFFVFCI